MTIPSPLAYCQLAGPVSGCGYSALPPELVATEKNIAHQNPAAAFSLNRFLCRSMLDEFRLSDVPWSLPRQFPVLYEQQIARIRANLADRHDDYFSLGNDPFRKDLAILRHRLIPFGAELATPYAGIPRSLLVADGWHQAIRFVQVYGRCRSARPMLELHMHPHCTEAFNPSGWLDTYENLADFLELNRSFRGVQSTSWFLDPVLAEVSPHLSYLREVPQRCGATILYADDDDPDSSGAFAASQKRRSLYESGHYRPRLFTRIWPRRQLLQRTWRSLNDIHRL